jgi:hypothetical protein
LQTVGVRLESTRNFIENFPINEILFVLSVGAFVILSFPFDVFKFFTDSPTVTFYLWNGFLSIPSIPDISNYFQPFINLHYLQLDNLASGIAMIIFLSLMIGAIIQCSMSIFEWINRRISWIYRSLYEKKYHKKKEAVKENWIAITEEMNFHRWLFKNRFDKMITFIVSMRQIAVALLYGSEILFGATLICGLFISDKIFWGGWMEIVIIITLFSIIAYLTSESRYWRSLNSFVYLFSHDEKRDAQDFSI